MKFCWQHFLQEKGAQFCLYLVCRFLVPSAREELEVCCVVWVQIISGLHSNYPHSNLKSSGQSFKQIEHLVSTWCSCVRPQSGQNGTPNCISLHL